MPFTPNTDEDFQKMLDTIGVSSFEELLTAIPEEVRLRKPMDLPEAMSEYEVSKLMQKYADMNISASTHACFMGGGAYDHYIPAIVGSVLEKPEFKTAYTPYQAEVSQGTLQAMYEYQSMICGLTGMDIANASMYDGATALAEACLLSNAQNKKVEFLIAGTLNPNYMQVLQTVCSGKKLVFISVIDENGTCDLNALKAAATGNTSAIIVQQPNAYGNIEEVQEIEKIAHSVGALFLVSVDPISLGMLQAPGAYNADIVVAEGQPLGIPMSFGGPYLGVFAAKMDFLRKIPGRLAGVTQDIDGNRGFVLTLQTREQQIKREKATSNICSNQGLMMLAATVYMSALGKNGIAEVAQQSFQKAHYLAEKVSAIPGYSLMNDKPFFREFLLKTPVPPKMIIEAGVKEGILPGIDTVRFPDCKPGLLVAVTEKRTKEEMDKFVELLKRFSL